jgi:hypothetical protein
MAPEAKFDATSSICSLGPRPLIVTGFLRQWFINHFANPDGIEAPELRGYLWKAVNTTDGIEIESITRWKPESTEKRPGIIIKRNDWKVLRHGIDDRMMGQHNFDGIQHHSTFLEGSHTLFCLSNLAPEAEILAGEVYREMMQFGPAIRKELDLKRFVLVAVGSMFKLEEARENYAVPVTVAYALEDSWELIPHGPLLKRIVISYFLP